MWSLLRRPTDAAVGMAARIWINFRLGRIGKVTELNIDSSQQKIRARLELTGDEPAIDVHVQKYSLNFADHKHPALFVEEASTSREWLTIALQRLLIGRAINLPHRAVTALKMLTQGGSRA